MKSLTICYITSRDKPMLNWFFDSLSKQVSEAQVLIIAPRRVPRIAGPPNLNIAYAEPKPSVWCGEHRLTKEDWWTVSNSRNTAVCFCKTDWVAFLDDRMVMMPGWISRVEAAMEDGYAIAGAYQKRTGMTAEDGIIKHSGIVIGEDSREQYLRQIKSAVPYACPGSWFFGCNFALPLEWLLQINGWDEICDSLGMEDVILGSMLENNGFPLRYDPRMKIIEDRTASESGPVMRKTDKGISPNDKSHALLAKLKDLKQTTNPWSIRQMRQDVLSGKPFPIPTEPTRDWYDEQPISEFV